MPQVSSQLDFRDHLGAWKVRWGIGRNSYLIPPGLYAIGRPDSESPVIVTANYKLSYDLVRRCLQGRNVWLLILETFGINVWCAAGKGSFGTAELVRRVEQVGLGRVVQHRELQLPILGAPGVAAHEVSRQTGFHIKYATIRATDLPEYLDNGMKTTAAMRELTFTLRERMVLVPIELMLTLRLAWPVLLLIFFVGWWGSDLSAGLTGCVALLGAIVSGTVLVPLLLPWLPGASFAGKGALTGLLWGAVWWLSADTDLGPAEVSGTLLLVLAVSAFCAFNFTGSTPFTSFSGVRKELRTVIPALAAIVFAAVFLWGYGLWL